MSRLSKNQGKQQIFWPHAVGKLSASDVETEQVLKIFKDIDKNENFYTLAWTTFEAFSSGRRRGCDQAHLPESAADVCTHPGTQEVH